MATTLRVKIDAPFQKKLERNAREFPQRLWNAYKYTAELSKRRAVMRTSGPPVSRQGYKAGKLMSQVFHVGFAGWVLRVRSNTLRSSISAILRPTGKDKIFVGVSARPFYAAIHELGKRKFLRPSVLEAIDWLKKTVEVWK